MDESDWSSITADVDRIRSHIRALEGVRHPLAGAEALERAADYVADCLTTLGYEVKEHHFLDNGRLYRNIIATFRGCGHQDERVVVMAHYDTVAGTPGADDNASGVAVLLETAELLAQYRFERTIQFVGVSLEENANENEAGTGTRGSRALAVHARENVWNIAGVVVLESVAYAGERPYRQCRPAFRFRSPRPGTLSLWWGTSGRRTWSTVFRERLRGWGASFLTWP
jgi:acetylornithine deacetylase/succinyl-diaminopimelate desuccinylase-like protein